MIFIHCVSKKVVHQTHRDNLLVRNRFLQFFHWHFPDF